MRLVKLVIGMVIGLIRLVGRVLQVQAIPNGGSNNTVADIQPQQLAKTTQKRKRKVVQQTTQVASRKRAPTIAKPKATQRGKQQATPVSKTRQHAKSAPKRKP